MTEPHGPEGAPPPAYQAPSAGAKIGAWIVGFLGFYALGLTLAGLLGRMGVLGGVVAVAVVIGALIQVLRTLRSSDPRGRGAVRYLALGFVSATIVFGGCLMLLSGL